MVYNLEFLQLQYLWSDMIRDVRPRTGDILLMGNAIYNFPPEVDRASYALTANPLRAVPFFVALGDVPRMSWRRTCGTMANCFLRRLRECRQRPTPTLLKEYPLVGTKQYERYGYTLVLYTFRFTFTR